MIPTSQIHSWNVQTTKFYWIAVPLDFLDGDYTKVWNWKYVYEPSSSFYGKDCHIDGESFIIRVD
jgi:hypothetical protein